MKNKKELPPLTPIQGEIYDYIVKYVEENGKSPMRREISEHMKFKGAVTASSFLRILEQKGYIELGLGKFRGIRLLT